MRANESRLRGRIAQAEAAAKARAEREAREAQAVRDRQQDASRKGTTYKPTESERSLMSRTGGLGSPRGQAYWPVRGTLLHRYGEQLQGELRWKGMVIAASEGTEVKAIADGRVILADWLQGYGLVVVVEHGKGDMSLYGYNQSALVSVGTQVRAGQPIARRQQRRSGPSVALFRNSSPGSGGQSTAVVGKISFASISQNCIRGSRYAGYGITGICR